MANRSSGVTDNEPLTRDQELGSAIRGSLRMPHDGAFISRVGALVRKNQERSWDEVLSGWFWRGLVATACTVMLVAASWVGFSGAATTAVAEESVAVQLLEGELPGSEVILASMEGIR
jgi:hypothetical protein